MKKVAILGAGISGLGAAQSLKQDNVDVVVYEKKSRPGGHATSHTSNGFIYDDGPHVSFTKDERIKALFAKNVGNEFYTVNVYCNNYWKGQWIKHPAQCNLYGLPAQLKVDILADFFNAQNSDHGEVSNYRDWLYASYGKTFSETFPMEYCKRYHTTDASNMSTEWVGPRLYRPDPKEVLAGAFSQETDNVHYVPDFRYPKHGGFESYLKPFVDSANVMTQHEAISIDPASRNIHFANGQSSHYDALVSSLPLPELVRIINGAPEHVVKAARNLACTQCVVVNIGINRPDISDYHWTYFYDDDFTFTRLSYPHMQSINNAPPGTGIIQAEVYFSEKYKPMDKQPDDYITPVIDDLRRCKLIRETDEILFSDSLFVPYANIIFDLDRTRSLEIVNNYLNEMGIHCCGRYGEWGYHWTDESFISGEKAGQKAIAAIRQATPE